MKFELAKALRVLFGDEKPPVVVAQVKQPTKEEYIASLYEELEQLGEPALPVDDLETSLVLLGANPAKTANAARKEAAEQGEIAAAAFKKVAFYRAKLEEFMGVAKTAVKTQAGLLNSANRIDAALNKVVAVDSAEPAVAPTTVEG